MRFHIPSVKFNHSIHFRNIPKPYKSIMSKAEFTNISGKKFLHGLPEIHVANLIKRGRFDTLVKQYKNFRSSKLSKSQILTEEYTKTFGDIKTKADFDHLYYNNDAFKNVITKIEKGANKRKGKLIIFGSIVTMTAITSGAYLYNKVEDYREEMIGCFKNVIKEREIVKCKIVKASCGNPKIGNMVNKCNTAALPSILRQAKCGSQTSGCIHCDGWDELDENIFYECNEDYTFNRALSDMVVAIGDDVVDAAVGLGKYIWYVLSILLIIICIIIGMFVIKSTKKITENFI